MEKFKSAVGERKLRSSEVVEVLTAAETSAVAAVAGEGDEPKNSSSGGKLMRLGDRKGLVRRRLLMVMLMSDRWSGGVVLLLLGGPPWTAGHGPSTRAKAKAKAKALAQKKMHAPSEPPATYHPTGPLCGSAAAAAIVATVGSLLWLAPALKKMGACLNWDEGGEIEKFFGNAPVSCEPSHMNCAFGHEIHESESESLCLSTN